MKLWDVRTGKPRATLKRNKLSDFAFSPDGKVLATASRAETEKGKWQYEVILWDAQTGEMKRTVSADLSVPVLSLAFSAGGKPLAVAGGRLGDVKDGAKASGEVRLIRLE